MANNKLKNEFFNDKETILTIIIEDTVDNEDEGIDVQKNCRKK